MNVAIFTDNDFAKVNGVTTSLRAVLRYVPEGVQRVFVPSESTRRLLIDSRIAPSRIELWTRGVDTAQFAPARRSSLLRERWRVCDRRPAVIYVGRLSKEKGLDLLPAIASALHRRGLEHRFVLVGDGPIRRDLQAQLPDAVFTGALSHLDVGVALALADVFVFPSDTDSAGNVVLEAQACGVPAIVSTAGGPREYIVNGETGEACQAGNAEAFGRAVAALLHDPARRRRMAEAARAHARTLSWDAALAPLYRAYGDLAAMRLRSGQLRPADASPAAGATA